MQELLYAIVEGLVDDMSAVKITEDAPDADGITVFHLIVSPSDMGRIIGKQGRNAKALRTIMRAGATKHNMKVAVYIGDGTSASDSAIKIDSDF